MPRENVSANRNINKKGILLLIQHCLNVIMGKGKAIKNNNNTSKSNGEKSSTGKRSNSKPKFKGNCADLEGCTFDCSDQ